MWLEILSIDYYIEGVRKRKKIGPSKQVAELALKDKDLRMTVCCSHLSDDHLQQE